jgi:hypothetical protein
MSRSTSRWLVLVILLLAVIGLGIYNTVANRRLVDELAAGKPAAFGELAERQDAYIFLQAEDQPTRAKIASNLGSWNDERSIGLMVKLLPDPDAEVRSNLVESLSAAAKRHPITLSAELSAAPPVTASALIEAAIADPEVGLQVLHYSLESNQENETGYLLAKRLGSVGKDQMIEIVRGGHSEGLPLAAGVLVGLDLTPEQHSFVSSRVYRAFKQSEDATYRDRLLPVMAKFAPADALAAFREVAVDDTAPSELRVAATEALVSLGDREYLDRLRHDPDTNVAAVLK